MLFMFQLFPQCEINNGNVIAAFRYIPAYSTRLTSEGNSWQVIPANASDSMGLVDPVWTESYWGTLGLRIYKVQSSAYDHLVLLGGVAVTAAAYLAVIVTRTCLVKALKHDQLHIALHILQIILNHT